MLQSTLTSARHSEPRLAHTPPFEVIQRHATILCSKLVCERGKIRDVLLGHGLFEQVCSCMRVQACLRHVGDFDCGNSFSSRTATLSMVKLSVKCRRTHPSRRGGVPEFPGRWAEMRMTAELQGVGETRDLGRQGLQGFRSEAFLLGSLPVRAI
jgi:hypothetical protein